MKQNLFLFGIAGALSLSFAPVYAVQYETPVTASSSGTTASTGSTLSGNAMVATSAMIKNQEIGYATDVLEDIEFKEALNWMADNGLTRYRNSSDYRSLDRLTREEASKIIGRFYKYEMKGAVKDGTKCKFVDSGSFLPDLAESIDESCRMGLFQGYDGKFFPRSGLTKGQAIAVLIRMLNGTTLPETTKPWYLNYYNAAYQLQITKDTNLNNFEREITRYEIALLLYRFKIKYVLLKESLDKARDKNEILGMVDGSTVYGSGGNRTGKMLADVSSLLDPNKSEFNMNIFGTKYKIVKQNVNNYGLANSYVWFGRFFDEQNTELGTVSLTILNGFLTEGAIRPNDIKKKQYKIKQGTELPYYIITEESVPSATK